MKINTGFDIGDSVRIKYGKFKEGIGRVLGISLLKKDDAIYVIYSIEVTLDNKVSKINRYENQIRCTDLVLKDNCSECRYYKETLYDGMCKECFVKYWGKLEDELYKAHRFIEEKKLNLFIEIDDIEEKENSLAEILTLFEQVKSLERKLNNARQTKNDIDGKRKIMWY